MSNGSLSNASRGRAPLSSTHATLVHLALFLLWYTLTSLTLLLPDKHMNTTPGHPYAWQLLITSLQEELSRLCTQIPDGRLEEYLYIVAGQRCIDAADLTPELFAHYERAKNIRMFSLRERGIMAVRTVYMAKTYET
ncbi:hypothetical protein CEK25_012505 [Fusarium fujikuroi]|nr:hypothetical protein CEK25_012505 [Fusarium fujikuroi]